MGVFVFPPVSANVTITGGATEATSLLIETNTENTVTELQTLNSVDFATEAKQDSQITEAQSTNTKLDSQISQATSTNSKLDAANASLDAIEADMDQLNAKIPAGLVPTAFDYISLTYVGATTDIQTVTYKSGGSGGTTVATLTLVYDGSNRLSNVTKA